MLASMEPEPTPEPERALDSAAEAEGLAPSIGFLAAFVLALAAYVAMRSTGNRDLALAVKPLPVFVLAMLVGRRGRDPLRRGIAMGLVWSGVGDVLIELPGRFVPGMAAFAAAHVAYLSAFVRADRRLALGRLAPLLVWCVPLLALTAPRLGPLTVPVIAYGTLLTAMMWRALARVEAGALVRSGAWVVAIGALVFGLSDSLILLRLARYVGEGVSAAVLATYWAGQLAIAVGATRR